jgi:putative transposase
LIVEFIDEYRDRFGVEPICVQLTELGCHFAPSTYYEARGRKPSARDQRDEHLKVAIAAVYDESYRCYGARKVWLTLRRQRVEVARCTVERLMRAMGLRGAVRGKRQRTTVADPAAARPADLVQRRFEPVAPDRLWVADFTYVSTLAGWVYVAFVVDAYSRRILGWKVSTRMTTDLVVAAINQATFTRRRKGVKDFAGLVHHTDAGSQYTSVRFTDRLAAEGITPSIGVVGDAHDNALAGSVNGLYKTELINPGRPWRSAEHVSAGTADYTEWYNHRRLYEYCGDMPPVEREQIHYCNKEPTLVK